MIRRLRRTYAMPAWRHFASSAVVLLAACRVSDAIISEFGGALWCARVKCREIDETLWYSGRLQYGVNTYMTVVDTFGIASGGHVSLQLDVSTQLCVALCSLFAN